MVFIVVQNLVVINAAVSIIDYMKGFNIPCIWLENAYSRPKIGV